MAHTHAQTNASAHTLIHTHTYTHTQTHRNRHNHIHAHTHTRTHTHNTRTHTRTHTIRRTCISGAVMGRVADRPRGRTAAATNERPLCIMAALSLYCMLQCMYRFDENWICTLLHRLLIHHIYTFEMCYVMSIIACCMLSCWILANWKIVPQNIFVELQVVECLP